MMAESNPRKVHNFIIPNDLLNDLSSRFIINVPEEERVDLIRLCFQIELAHWFYLDFYCEEDSKLVKVALKDFIHIIFRHIPFLQKYSSLDVDGIIADWREYKKAVPTFGAILLDEELKNVLLVQSFVFKASWGFPKGKVNKDEQPHHCAIREVMEETGFDITHMIDNDAYLEHTFNEQLIRLYIIHGISKDSKFRPRTRNEIKCCEWFPVNQLPLGRKDQPCKTGVSPNSLFMVIPFVKPLRKWIAAKNSQINQEKASHTTYDKASEIDKQLLKQQQQVYAQMTRNDYARYTENTSPADTRGIRQQNKSTYSPPPRMMKQRISDKKKNTQSEEKAAVQSKYHKKTPVGESSKAPDRNTGKKPLLTTQNGFCPSCIAWQNFSLDCEALIATFNINLRKKAAVS